MMLRFMAPDCQMISRNVSLKQLPYFGVYASIKATDLRLSEFARLKDKFAEVILAEHAMALFFATKTIFAIDSAVSISNLSEAESKEVFQTCSRILERLQQAGWTPKSEAEKPTTLADLVKLFDSLYLRTIAYLRTVSFTGKDMPYSDALLGFHDFLLPLFKDLSSLSFMPSGPIFLMIDDADNLSEKQTQILNTWVSSRSTDFVCLKIATQLNYKTYRTINEGKIASPHDFSESNITSIYTSPKERYPNWVKEIVRKRLQRAAITASPEEFFPEDKAQEAKIEEIAKELKANWPKFGRGYRPEDDAYRYARPEYIKRLRGSSKQGSTYRYAGFKQIVHISSGVIRHFLESASLMYGEQRKHSKHGTVQFIDPRIQHDILKGQSDNFMMAEFDRLAIDEQQNPDNVTKTQRLKNLVTVLGGLFQMILVSNAAERRIFSFALSDELDPEVKEVLKLGIENGYLYEAAIGTKEGTGRTRLYVLSRMMAPHFLLDPTGFSAYKFVTNEFLRSAILHPTTTLRSIKNRIDDEVIGSSQRDLFSEETSS